MDSIEIKSPADRYKAIADAIRKKNGTTELMQPADMPQAILDIVSSGGGITYTDIVYNEDNTITLTDKNGVEHTMSCTYEDDKLVGVTYDGKAVELTYEGDVLVKVGKTEVDVANANITGIEPLDHTVTFTVDGEPYEVVSVKDGNSVNEPTEPTSDTLLFMDWLDDNENVILFPYMPENDVVLHAFMAESLSVRLYEFYGVDKNEYPYIFISTRYTYKNNRLSIYFAPSYDDTKTGSDLILMDGPLMLGNCTDTTLEFTGTETASEIASLCISKIPSVASDSMKRYAKDSGCIKCYSNIKSDNATNFV